MVKTLVWACIVCAPACCYATAETSVEGRRGPRATIEQTEVYLGICPYKQPVKHRFYVRNDGDEPLRFFFISKSCGCVTDVLPGSSVSPGSEAPVEVGYNPVTGRERTGENSFTVLVGTNDPTRKHIQFTVKAQLVKPVEVNPAVLEFGRLTATDLVERYLTINCYHDSKESLILSVRPSDETLAVSPVSETPTRSGLAVKYLVTLNGARLPLTYRGNITVTTSQPELPTIEVPVLASSVQSIEIVPPRILFGIVQNGTEKTCTAVVRETTEGVAPARVSCPDQRITAELMPAPQNDTWHVRALLYTDQKPTDPLIIKTSIHIKAADGRIIAEIPVFGVVACPSQ